MERKLTPKLSAHSSVISKIRTPKPAGNPYTSLSFSDIEKQASAFADHIENHMEELVEILLEYESYEVATDEIARALDLMRNLKENRAYFRLRVNEVAVFLPKNQPLYALSCFVIVPSLMAHQVHFRIPHSMRHFFPKLLAVLAVQSLFPNIHISDKTRLDFLRERSALRVHPKTGESLPMTDAVIFTGKSSHAEQLRLIFDHRTLFILNGAGHNPVIVGPDADIEEAVQAVLALELYNQGQDCAAPNAILVHAEIREHFLRRLREEIKRVRVGPYRDRSNRVGPISDAADLVRIQELLIHNRSWLDSSTSGIIRSKEAIVEPTIICKPLREGGNFHEVFAPIIFIQEYTAERELASYFENPHYTRNAMYVSLYGSSEYIHSLINRPIEGKVVHDRLSLLVNRHLHERGVERGTQPYGGLGYAASSLFIGGKTIPKPTLPQRDIYEHVAKPLLHGNACEVYRRKLKSLSRIEEKNIEKLLKLSSQIAHEGPRESKERTSYIDARLFRNNSRTYIKIDEKHLISLLEHPNVAYISELVPDDVAILRGLKDLLGRREALSQEKFAAALYALPREFAPTPNRLQELKFFQHIYALLFDAKSGPRLTQFLFEVDLKKINKLLDI